MGGGPDRGSFCRRTSRGGAMGWFARTLRIGSWFGNLADQTGRIESAVVVHVLFNLLNIVLTWISTSASV